MRKRMRKRTEVGEEGEGKRGRGERLEDVKRGEGWRENKGGEDKAMDRGWGGRRGSKAGRYDEAKGRRWGGEGGEGVRGEKERESEGRTQVEIR